MKLTTIWTLRGMPLRERLNRTGEWALCWVAHRLPRSLAYRSLIDTGVRHIGPREVVPEVRFMDIVQRAGAGEDPRP